MPPTPPKDPEPLATIVVDCAYHLHRESGPGLLESVYEVVLTKLLEQKGLKVARQKKIPINLMGIHFEEGFRPDLIIEDSLIVEIKSLDQTNKAHAKQVLTYLKLLNLPLGLLINFGHATLRDGCQRIINQHDLFTP